MENMENFDISQNATNLIIANIDNVTLHLSTHALILNSVQRMLITNRIYKLARILAENPRGR